MDLKLQLLATDWEATDLEITRESAFVQQIVRDVDIYNIFIFTYIVSSVCNVPIQKKKGITNVFVLNPIMSALRAITYIIASVCNVPIHNKERRAYKMYLR